MITLQGRQDGGMELRESQAGLCEGSPGTGAPCSLQRAVDEGGSYLLQWLHGPPGDRSALSTDSPSGIQGCPTPENGTGKGGHTAS